MKIAPVALIILLFACTLVVSTSIAASLTRNLKIQQQTVQTLNRQLLETKHRIASTTSSLEILNQTRATIQNNESVEKSIERLSSELQTSARASARKLNILLANSQISTSIVGDGLSIVTLKLDFQSNEDVLLRFLQAARDLQDGVFLSSLRILDNGQNANPDQQLRVYLEISRVASDEN